MLLHVARDGGELRRAEDRLRHEFDSRQRGRRGGEDSGGGLDKLEELRDHEIEDSLPPGLAASGYDLLEEGGADVDIDDRGGRVGLILPLGLPSVPASFCPSHS